MRSRCQKPIGLLLLIIVLLLFQDCRCKAHIFLLIISNNISIHSIIIPPVFPVIPQIHKKFTGKVPKTKPHPAGIWLPDKALIFFQKEKSLLYMMRFSRADGQNLHLDQGRPHRVIQKSYQDHRDHTVEKSANALIFARTSAICWAGQV